MFKETPVNNKSLAKRKLFLGVGVNDSNYRTTVTVNGKQERCPFYIRWSALLSRCYSVNTQIRRPTYEDCTVCDEWLVFSNFKSWMEKQEWQGKHLDKDILIQGNKVYSPEYCLFVSLEINNLFIDSKKTRGDLPLGVSNYIGSDKKYQANCSVNGKNKNLGHYFSPEEAHEAYKSFKYDVIANVALRQTEPLKAALLNYKIKE